jgi:hypothetical protein
MKTRLRHPPFQGRPKPVVKTAESDTLLHRLSTQMDMGLHQLSCVSIDTGFTLREQCELVLTAALSAFLWSGPTNYGKRNGVLWFLSS